MIDFGKKLLLRDQIRKQVILASLMVTLTMSFSVLADSSEECSESIWDVVRNQFTGITNPNYKYRCLRDKNSKVSSENDKKYFESQDSDQIFRANSTQNQGSNALDIRTQGIGTFEMGHNFTTRGGNHEDNVIESVNGFSSVSRAKKAQ